MSNKTRSTGTTCTAANQNAELQRARTRDPPGSGDHPRSPAQPATTTIRTNPQARQPDHRPACLSGVSTTLGAGGASLLNQRRGRPAARQRRPPTGPRRSPPKQQSERTRRPGSPDHRPAFLSGVSTTLRPQGAFAAQPAAGRRTGGPGSPITALPSFPGFRRRFRRRGACGGGGAMGGGGGGGEGKKGIGAPQKQWSSEGALAPERRRNPRKEGRAVIRLLRPAGSFGLLFWRATPGTRGWSPLPGGSPSPPLVEQRGAPRRRASSKPRKDRQGGDRAAGPAGSFGLSLWLAAPATVGGRRCRAGRGSAAAFPNSAFWFAAVQVVPVLLVLLLTESRGAWLVGALSWVVGLVLVSRDERPIWLLYSGFSFTGAGGAYRFVVHIGGRSGASSVSGTIKGISCGRAAIVRNNRCSYAAVFALIRRLMVEGRWETRASLLCMERVGCGGYRGSCCYFRQSSVGA